MDAVDVVDAMDIACASSFSSRGGDLCGVPAGEGDYRVSSSKPAESVVAVVPPGAVVMVTDVPFVVTP